MIAVVAAGCGGSEPSGSAELRVREIHAAGAPYAIEGEYTYVRVDGSELRLEAFDEGTFALDPGRHTLEVWHRTCDGNCAHLDPPRDRCRRTVTTETGVTALATIHNSPGSPCRIVIGQVGIAYVQPDDGSVWFAASGGTRKVRLAHGNSPIAELSPDGRWVALVRSLPGGYGLFVAPTSGGKARLVRRTTGFRAQIGGVVWAPDSERLVSIEVSRLVLVDLRRDATRPFASGGPPATDEWLEHPTFRSDGSAIAFGRHSHEADEVLTYAMRQRTILSQTYKGHFPVWGPERLAFLHGGGIWLTLGFGIRAKLLTDSTEGAFPVAWSADGSRLLAASFGFRTGRLWAVDVPSGDARPLTGWVYGLRGQGLSYDGRTILAATGCSGPPVSHPEGTIETIPFMGGKPSVIVNGPCSASWNE